MSLTINDLTEELRDVALQVNTAQERVEDRDVVVAAHQSVERISQRYRELCASLDETGKAQVERALGRRLTDLRRLASLLPRVGGVVSDSTPDRVMGTSEVGKRRITGVSWNPAGAGPVATGTQVRVGGEVEAWCGPCGGLTSHHVVAMMGDDPKQVVCQTCGGRHGFRTTPARKGVLEEAGVSEFAPSRADAATAKMAEKKAEELRQLAVEVNRAADVRPFDPKARYKAGEVIAHPDHGRGKVETVLRASLLVRFASGGLKSVMLQS